MASISDDVFIYLFPRIGWNVDNSYPASFGVDGSLRCRPDTYRYTNLMTVTGKTCVRITCLTCSVCCRYGS